MLFKPTEIRSFRAKRGLHQTGFTLIEVLAALALMAIVIPVAIQGVRVAGLAGEVGARKLVAARIAQRVLDEAIVTKLWQSSMRNGTVVQGSSQYTWSLNAQQWVESPLRLLTVRVDFSAQDHRYDVQISTLADPSIQ